MCLIVEICMFVMGLLALIRGRLTILTRTGESTGTPARIAGAVLMLPIPLALCGALAFGLALAASGKEYTEKELRDNLALRFIEPALVLFCLAVAIGIGLLGRNNDNRQRLRDNPFGEGPEEQKYFHPDSPPQDDRFRR